MNLLHAWVNLKYSVPVKMFQERWCNDKHITCNLGYRGGKERVEVIYPPNIWTLLLFPFPPKKNNQYWRIQEILTLRITLWKYCFPYGAEAEDSFVSPTALLVRFHGPCPNSRLGGQFPSVDQITVTSVTLSPKEMWTPSGRQRARTDNR